MGTENVDATGGSEYSNASSLSQQEEVQECIDAFANGLSNALHGRLDAIRLKRIPSALPSILKAFAVRLGYECNDRMQRQLMYFVSHFRHNIASRLEHILNSKLHGEEASTMVNDVDKDIARSGKPTVSLQEEIQNWRRKSNATAMEGTEEVDLKNLDNLDPLGDLDDLLELHEFVKTIFPNLAAYHDMLTNTPAYKWLLSSIQSRSAMEIPGSDDVEDHIRDKILSNIGSPENFSPIYVQEVCMRFKLDWELVRFVEEQKYNRPLPYVLAHAITLTGYGNNLQATTCEDYMKQTWPETGPRLLKFLQSTLETDAGTHQEDFLDQTVLAARLRGSKLQVIATGSMFSVAEVGEQLAWIGAALRSSPHAEEAVYSTAYITELDVKRTVPFNTRIYRTCEIRFRIERLNDSDLAKNGNCWRGMFRNPVIVRGYPILCRPEAESGIEVPLEVAAGLTNCSKLVKFAKMTFLKGFAAMLAAVHAVDNVVFWHLCYNANGDPCAKYRIGWTDLPEPNSKCIFEKITISGPSIPFISSRFNFAIGIKDKPLHLGFGNGDDYMGTLFVVGKRNFVFYDTEEKRAWLVDGASTVLHLLRAYLKSSLDDDRIRDCFSYSDGDLEEASPDLAYTGARAAYNVLRNINNQNVALYAKAPAESEEKSVKLGMERKNDDTRLISKGSYFTVKERVEQICHVLLQITAYHDDLDTEAGYGWRLKKSPYHKIEGFEFMDVATQHNTLWPKVATIQAMSLGWVHFIRSLHAVPLFGVGFGDLIRPNGPKEPCCASTSPVPMGKDFLAAYGADLEEILRKGSSRKALWRLTGNIYWHAPGGRAFETCNCAGVPDEKGKEKVHGAIGKPNNNKSGSEQDEKAKKYVRGLGYRSRKKTPSPAERVQVLLPATFPQLYGRGLRSPPKMASTGAVIFGHCAAFPLRWSLTDDRPPEEREPDPLSVEEVSSLMGDSGIYLSTTSSSRTADSKSPSLYNLGYNPSIPWA